MPYCTACTGWVYPAADACPECGQTPVPRPVPDTGTVFTYTVNHHRYRPGITVPYAIALVEIDRAPGFRVITEIVGCEPGSVYTGMPVRLSSGYRAGTGHPVFTPRDTASA